jgi:hypothetical protein
MTDTATACAAGVGTSNDHVQVQQVMKFFLASASGKLAASVCKNTNLASSSARIRKVGNSNVQAVMHKNNLSRGAVSA